MPDGLKRQVFEANLRILKEGLVLLNWGNVSAVDRDRNLLVIKPSGMAYDAMTAGAMVPVSLADGKALEGELRPSSDTPTHRELYRAFPAIRAIVHTHSHYATAWAQAGREIPALGTTHADCFDGPIPVTRSMREGEIRADYERNTGKVIVERFRKVDPMRVPAVLVRGHGPFVWGASIEEAIEHAIVLERVALMASVSLALNPSARPIGKSLLDKHFSRKHGPAAYYGQKRT
jgi:L-ribulose-5-phosphate 4-epimerase